MVLSLTWERGSKRRGDGGINRGRVCQGRYVKEKGWSFECREESEVKTEKKKGKIREGWVGIQKEESRRSSGVALNDEVIETRQMKLKG